LLDHAFRDRLLFDVELAHFDGDGLWLVRDLAPLVQLLRSILEEKLNVVKQTLPLAPGIVQRLGRWHTVRVLLCHLLHLCELLLDDIPIVEEHEEFLSVVGASKRSVLALCEALDRKLLSRHFDGLGFGLLRVEDGLERTIAGVCSSTGQVPVELVEDAAISCIDDAERV